MLFVTVLYFSALEAHGDSPTTALPPAAVNVEKVSNPNYQAIKQQARQWAAFKNWELEVK